MPSLITNSHSIAEVDNYGFKIVNINELNEISNKEHIHYIYKNQNCGIHFLYKPVQNALGLLVAFHGARWSRNSTIVPLPMFRSFNYPEQTNNISVLSICDPLLHKYAADNLTLSWFLSTKKCQTTKTIVAIIERISELENHNFLFFGTSGGGFPAIKYAGIFDQQALLSNSQLMLGEAHSFNNMISVLKKNQDEIIDPININEQLVQFGFPKRITLYINTLDEHHMKCHAKPLIEWFKTQGKLDGLNYYAFEEDKDKSPHHFQWPNNVNRDQLIKELIQNGRAT